jgi:hypothetical protein
MANKPSPLNTSSFDGSSSSVKSPKSPLSGNPLKYDPELMTLIDRVDSIQSYRTFRRWKASFLRRFESFLKQKGIPPAEDSYQAYSSNMERFETKVNQVQGFMERGDLTPDRTSVKGRNALNEMCKTITEIIEETENLIPSTNLDEKKKQYNKYHLGCVLVKDGFLEYDRMLRCKDKIQAMIKEQGLKEVADRQQLEAIQMYETQIERFRDVMHDLGLYEVMMKCRQFADGEMSEIIFLDPKTGAVIELPRDVVFESGVLSIVQDEEGAERIREEEISRAEKEEMMSTIRDKFLQ